MTNHQKGYRRDRQVIETIAEWGTMDTEQLTILFYPSSRVAQRRLKILTAKGKLKRYREAIELPYSYCIRNYDYIRLVVNWVRVWLLKRLKSWEVLEWDYGTNTAIVRNPVGGSHRTYNILYNVNRKTWVSGEAIIIYDTNEQRNDASKRIKGTLLTVEEIREGLK